MQSFQPNENVLGDLWIKFLEGDWQREAKRWDEEEDFEAG
jgi:hypothetical protein